jgi:hypothetical protein
MYHFDLHILQKVFLWASIFFVIITLGYEFLLTQNTDFPDGENNIVFLLDVSQSMNVIDMWEYSRIDESKRKIIDIMKSAQANNFALSIFAGESLRILPFTTDIGLISTFLLGLDSWNVIKQGSDIPWALLTGIESFNEQQSWKVILLTDGSDDDISISSEIKDMFTGRNIELMILGVWTSRWWYIPSNSPLNPYKMYKGSIVMSSLNSENLQWVAESMWGKYVNIQEYLDYSWLWEPNNTSSFPYIFLLFIVSWFLYLLCVYKSIFSKISSIWNLK